MESSAKRLKNEWHRIRNSPVVRNVGWVMIGQVGGYVLQAGYFVLLARLLGVVQYGIFAGAFAFVNLVARYGTLGTGSLFLRYVSVNRNQFALLWGNVLFVTICFGAIMVVILHVLGFRVLNPASASLVLLAAISNCLGMQVSGGVAIVFQTYEKLKLSALMNLLISLLRTITAAGMFVTLHHASAWQWAVASTVVSLAGGVASIALVIAQLGAPRFSLDVFRKHLLEGCQYAFASSTASAYNDLDKTMLSHYGMNAANGIYTMAYRVIDIATMPILSARDAVSPRIFQAGKGGIRESAAYVHRILKRVFLYSLGAAATMYLVAPWLPRFVGHSFTEASTALRWLCIIVVFRSVHEVMGYALTAAGLQHFRTGTQLIAAISNFGLNLWLIPIYGWRGAAWASLATDGSLCVMNWCVVKILTRKRLTAA
jgi:O-antigen/teichoic acid export membrane protein